MPSRPNHAAQKIHRQEKANIRTHQVQHRQDRHRKASDGQQGFVSETISELSPGLQGEQLTQKAGSQPSSVAKVRQMNILKDVQDEKWTGDQHGRMHQP
jgi:hypothetical protein